MHTEVQSVDEGCNRKLVKCLHDVVVEFAIVQIDTLLSEVELLGHLSAFVVTSQQEDVVRKPLLQSKEQQHDFGAVATSVHVVAQEKHLAIQLLRSVYSLKYPMKIIELPVYISHNCHFSINPQKIWLLTQDN